MSLSVPAWRHGRLPVREIQQLYPAIDAIIVMPPNSLQSQHNAATIEHKKIIWIVKTTPLRVCVVISFPSNSSERQPRPLAVEQILQSLLYRYRNIVAKDLILPVVDIVVVSDNQLIGIHICCDWDDESLNDLWRCQVVHAICWADCKLVVSLRALWRWVKPRWVFCYHYQKDLRVFLSCFFFSVW